jgi:aryl-alcohol dehydrogenase-like predicted oxidoreductase
MILRRLGATQLLVTPIGLGLAALGRPAYINLGRESDLGGERSVEAMERRCHAMLDEAFEAGVRYFDTARSYGLAEQFLSSWLKSHPIPRDTPTVGSKWGYTYTGEWQMEATAHEVKDLSLETLRRQVAESRALLRTHLRLYQIHSATLESGVLENREVLVHLARLRAEGLAIGLSVSGPRQAETIRRALAVAIDGENPFQTVQATWNVLEPSAGAALAEARSRGWGVIAKEVLANGRLTNRHAGKELAALVDRARDLDTTVDALAIAAVLAQPWVDVVLSGAVNEQQLRSHLSALAIPMEAVALPDLAEPPSAYWSHRGTLTWR